MGCELDLKQEIQRMVKIMKIFYIAQENFYCVVYADSKQAAFEKVKETRKSVLEILGLPLDITQWRIEEFTPDLYDGVLCFY